MRFYGAEYNNIERGKAEFNFVVLCSIKPPIGIKNRNFVEDLPMIISGQFGFNYPSGFREEAL